VNSLLFFPQNAVYLTMLSFFVSQIFTFYTQSALKFVCPDSSPQYLEPFRFILRSYTQIKVRFQFTLTPFIQINFFLFLKLMSC
jgi:hypothetical protein